MLSLRQGQLTASQMTKVSSAESHANVLLGRSGRK